MLTTIRIIVGLLAISSDRGFIFSGAGRWSAHGLQCYTDVAATEITVCKENEGFRTCFTKYNDSKFRPPARPKGEMQEYEEGQVTGRGCSTKDKVFYKECETHSYGDQVEKMCFCSFFLCNGVQTKTPSLTLTMLAASAVLLITATQLELFSGNSSSSTMTETPTVAKMDPSDDEYQMLQNCDTDSFTIKSIDCHLIRTNEACHGTGLLSAT